jgi:hypothetical protein
MLLACTRNMEEWISTKGGHQERDESGNSTRKVSEITDRKM